MAAWVENSLLMRVPETVTYREQRVYNETLDTVKAKYYFFSCANPELCAVQSDSERIRFTFVQDFLDGE